MHLVVDIDQTLYPLLRAIGTLPGGEGVVEERCYTWFSLQTMCQRPAEELIREAIAPEVALAVGLYDGAGSAILGLANQNIEIALATHRSRRNRDITEVFLRQEGLGDFPLYQDEDLQKEKLLFKEGIIVDDAPHVLRAAANRGLRATTLAHLYNEEVAKEWSLPRGKDWNDLEVIIKQFLTS